ncbi:MAG TPA: amidohydrolase family protein [Steroidobacteraceae bacterium]|nr:amidohydrolase family protein [Steroidobacteraceae bacterium]
MSEVMICSPPSAAPELAGPVRTARRGITQVIDIHAHLAVPAAEALLRPYAAQAPAMGFSSPDSDAVNRELFARIGRKLSSLDERLVEMDATGIDIQALSPLPGQTIYAVPPDVAREAARITNDGIAAAVARHPDRFVGMGIVPLQSPELAIAEMKRCTKELGLRGIEISSHVNGRELADPGLRPVFAAAEEAGVLLFLHPLGFTHGERLRDHYLNNLLGNPIDSTIAVAHLIFDGVLEQLPGLKLCVAHGGGYAATYWGRLDHAWRARPDCRRHISKPPSQYLRMLYFDTLVFDKAQLRFLIETHGADHLCLGTDYPFDMSEPDPIGFHAEVAESDRDKILGATAAALLGLS